ncbi:MAG TPA: ABC transporter ATP-binding protein [Candidatus Binatia bacterium]|jgi:iron(III) transport system ATP-binding protein
MIRVQNLEKTFAGAKGEVRALCGVSFEVHKGELFTLLGPSGCGKTTTLRCIAGLEQPIRGEIGIDDRTVYSAGKGIFIAPEKRRIGMVFQSYAIWPHLTVFQNVAYPLAGQHRVADRVMAILQRLGLDHLADRLAPNLSGGQQQRVALARALVGQPEVLLLDEPLSNLDAKLREQMRSELRSLQESFQITTVYVTHDQEEALALSDCVGLMHEGALLEVGDPRDLYLQPAHRMTAAFLGAANFVPAAVEGDDGRAGKELGLATPLGNFIARRSEEWQPGMMAELFFRPEYVDLLEEDAVRSGFNFSTGVVERVTFLGNSADVLIRSGEVLIKARVHPSGLPTVNKKIKFFVAPDHCIVFPANGGG